VSQRDLIGILNPVIRGWANYYRSVVSAKAFGACDSFLVKLLRSWSTRRHAHKNRHWVFRRYWRPTATWTWNFATSSGVSLWWHAKTTIRRHVKVKGTASPFDGQLAYWAQRLKVHPLTGYLLGQLLREQQGRCSWCHRYFLDSEAIEIDHILPRSLGGTNAFSNRQALHRHCHDQKTTKDGSPSGKSSAHDKRHIAEEPCDGKPSRTVLQAGGGK
jgi:RNA-directed DNA polymerase